MADLDIVIVNYKSAGHIFNCVRSVHEAARHDGIDAHVIVVNNSDDGPALEDAVTHAGGAAIIQNSENLGFGAACTIGAQQGQSDFVFFLNPDAMVQPDCLRRCVAFMRNPARTTVGIVGPALHDENGQLLLTCSRLPTAFDLIARTVGLHVLFKGLTDYPYLSAAAHARNRFVGQVMGAALMIRRSLFESLGGFDPAFFLYYEDVDLCARAQAAGMGCFYLRDAHASHVGAGSSSQAASMSLALHIASRLTYARRHFGVLAQLALLLVCAVIEAPVRIARAALSRDGAGAVLRAYHLLLLRFQTGKAIPILNARLPEIAIQTPRRRILALTRYDRVGASSRVRFLQYIPHLQRLGLYVAARPLLPPGYVERLYKSGTRSPVSVAWGCAKRLWTLLTTPKTDLIWLQRELLPFMPFSVEQRLLAGRTVVIDFDDAHHLYYKKRKSALARVLYGNKIEQLMRRADAVTVGNQTLADYAREAGAKNIHLIPSAVDVSAFKASAENPDGRFAIGWIGTPMTADDTLPLVQEALVRVLSETNATCVLMGVQPGQFPDIKAERLPWSEAGLADFFARIDVGICPLPDTAWHRGKSGYKIIQYMAAGKPTLASPVGIAAEIVVEGQTGLHCRTSEDWYTALMTLYTDTEIRTAMGQCAQAIAQARYDTAVAAADIARIFESSISK